MEIIENIQNNVCQVNLNGSFDAHTSGAVEQFIRERMEKGSYQFVLNMKKVSLTTSSGLRVILVIAKELRNKYQGDIRIASPQPIVHKVFTISGVDNVLQIFDDMEKATKSFA